jgi:hypothetical protein
MLMMSVLNSLIPGSLKTAKAEEFPRAIRSALIFSLYADDFCHIELSLSSTAAHGDGSNENEVEDGIKDIGGFSGGRLQEPVHAFVKSGESEIRP